MAERDREKRGRKLLLTLLVVGVVGSLAGIGTFSAFSSTTSNSGNSFAAGTVYLTDNDANSAMFNVSNATPGSYSSCITVTYLGSLPATVKLYGSGFGGALAPYLTIKVEEGTGAAGFGNCTGFTASSTVYNDVAMASFPTLYSGATATGGTWTLNKSVDYRLTVTLANDNNANGGASPLAANNFSFTWEAQNV
ncbi:MAG TPA: SipW-dependent-type signal peptide-containing protein [Actinomycetota bacterium]